MDSIASRDLRNDTAGVLRRVEAGERLLVMVGRRPVAALVPLPRRSPWVAADRVWERIGASQADSALRSDLRAALEERVAGL